MSKLEIINEMINESEKIIERIIELSTFTPEQKKVIESEKLKLKKTKQNGKYYNWLGRLPAHRL